MFPTLLLLRPYPVMFTTAFIVIRQMNVPSVYLDGMQLEFFVRQIFTVMLMTVTLVQLHPTVQPVTQIMSWS